MNKDTSEAFRLVADYIEKHKINWQESSALLRHIADEKEAQSVVCQLRDDINKPLPGG